MRILVDADGCPVVAAASKLAAENGLECIVICDTSHEMTGHGTQVITVSKGADSADFALVNMIRKEDVVVTQDYGLAAMSLARGAVVLSQDGMRYTADNIDALLHARHTAGRIRRGGGRLRGPKKRTAAQDEAFAAALAKILSRE